MSLKDRTNDWRRMRFNVVQMLDLNDHPLIQTRGGRGGYLASVVSLFAKALIQTHGRG
jgi:hypothetical protein